MPIIPGDEPVHVSDSFAADLPSLQGGTGTGEKQFLRGLPLGGFPVHQVGSGVKVDEQVYLVVPQFFRRLVRLVVGNELDILLLHEGFSLRGISQDSGFKKVFGSAGKGEGEAEDKKEGKNQVPEEGCPVPKKFHIPCVQQGKKFSHIQFPYCQLRREDPVSLRKRSSRSGA